MGRKSHYHPLALEGHSLTLAGAPGDGKDTLILVTAAAGCSPTPSAEKYLHFQVRSTAHLEQFPLLLDFPSLTATAFEGTVARVISFSQYQVKVLLSIRWAKPWRWPWTTESAQRGYACTNTCNCANIHKRHKTTIKRMVHEVTAHFSTRAAEGQVGIRTCDETASPYTSGF